MYPRIMKELKERAKENGESLSSSNGGFFANALRKIEEYKQGMGMEFGYFPRPNQSSLPAGGNSGEMPTLEQMEAMLKASNPTQDSTLP